MKSRVSIERFKNKVINVLRSKEGQILKFSLLKYYYIGKIVIGKNENMYQKLISVVYSKLLRAQKIANAFI